ncbi:MAG: manganese efflux pump [Synergistes jonesii]|uniref:manganese efflux pump MntP n=1 Tax=Synergistes jonesii TaxID=2754 RepID=UPI002A75C366|nr:manganese efflux pump [Synergistes jonesii]MDY2985181.1 manganese efflux pump [Synergistes jonesii]
MTGAYLGTLAATAASLAMDAFSVSICIGLCRGRLLLREALILGCAFGFFQFFMPLAGGEAGEHLSAFLDNKWTPWIAATLIIWVAANMIRDAGGGEERESYMSVTPKNVAILAFATSLDALAVGFSISSTGGSALLLALLAGAITFSLSFFGALAGKRLGARFGKKAEYVGGGVLLAIAAKIIATAVI